MPDDRKSRGYWPALFLVLVILYFFKFKHPQNTILGSISTHITNSSSATEQLSKVVESKDIALGPDLELQRTSKGSSRLQADSQISHPNGTIIDRVAVIIEDHPSTHLIPLILHFSSVLGPQWPIVIYTYAEAIGVFTTSAALKRQLRAGLISVRIRPIPGATANPNSDSVTRFLTDSWLWENLAPAKHVLIFQSDTMICSKSARSVEDFFEYDFVGATIAGRLGSGVNGAISLRNRETALRVLAEFSWEKYKGTRFEERWYFDRMWDIKNHELAEGIKSTINLPTIEISRTFAVEKVGFPPPLGVHQARQYMDGAPAALDDWCPEYKLCSSEWPKKTE